MRHINAAASVTPVNLLALALLATPRQATLREDLLRHLDTLLAVLRAVPYSERVTITDLSPAAIVDYGVSLQMITRETHRAGEFVRMSAENAVLATYYRNNVLHLVAMPSLMACCFIANAELRALVQELEAEPSPDAALLFDARRTWANSEYYMTWLARLEGVPETEWEPRIEAARQVYKLLAGDGAASAETKRGVEEDLESAIRLARMDLGELTGLPLPSQ